MRSTALGPKPIETLIAFRSAQAVFGHRRREESHQGREPRLSTRMRVCRFPTAVSPTWEILRLRYYTPENAKKDSNLPVIMYVHGGGWVIADLDTYDASPTRPRPPSW